VLFLLIIRLGLWGFLLGPFFFFAYVIFFGRAFVLSLRQLQALRSTLLRFATPILCTIFLLFCSFTVGGYVGDRLNSLIFHMTVQDFDK
jgi:heme/copper-type cytochrome/quinol oxidase subunit 3